MDFRFTEQEEGFRQEVRSFLEKELPPDWDSRAGGIFMESGSEDYWDTFCKMARKLGEKGWIGLGMA